MEVADVTGCRCHEGGTLCPQCAEQVRRLMRGEEHDLMVPHDPQEQHDGEGPSVPARN